MQIRQLSTFANRSLLVGRILFRGGGLVAVTTSHQPPGVLAPDTVVHGNVHALVAEVVSHSEALQALTMAHLR